MLMHPTFENVTLHNRLGQEVQLRALHSQYHGRDYVFVSAPEQNIHFIGKNAEPFAFQLRELFALDVRRFELIEVRNDSEEITLIRWRFEWVGHSPLSARAEIIASPTQQEALLALINPVAEIAATA